MRKVFDEFDIDYQDLDDELRLPCPLHEGDRKDGFSWSFEHGQFGCWTRGCHDEVQRDSLGLIRLLGDWPLWKAIDFVFEKIDGDDAIPSDSDGSSTQVRSTKEKKLPTITLGDWDFSYLTKRGFDRKIIKDHGAFRCLEKPLNDRIVFPIRDLDGKIIAYTGRTLWNHKDENGVPSWERIGAPKWKHIGRSSHSFFDAYRAQHAIRNAKSVLLCEGVLDVLKLEQAGVQIALACFGISLSNLQKQLLSQLGVTKIWLGGDSDEAGQKGFNKVYRRLNGMFNVKKVQLVSKDWGDMTVPEIQELCCKFDVPFRGMV